MMYRAVIYWKRKDDKGRYYNDYALDIAFTVKKFVIKAIFDYFINQLFIEFIQYPNNPDRREENRR